MVKPLAPYKINQKDINLGAISQVKQPVQPTQQPKKQGKLSFVDFAQRIKTKYPEYKDLADLDLTERMIQAYPQYKEQVELPERFRGAEILAGISRAGAGFIPKTVGGIAKFIGKQGVAPGLDIQTPQTEALTKFGEKATEAGQQAEEFVRKGYSELGVQQDTAFRKGGQLGTDIALSVAGGPKGPSFPGFSAGAKPLAKYVAGRGLIGASEEMRYNLGTEGQVLSDKRPYDLAIGTTAEVVAPMLPSIAKGLYKGAKELPSMIKGARETVSEIPGAIGQKVTRDFPIGRIEKDLNLTPTERATVERTGETSGNYVLRKNIGGLDKPAQINELQKIADEGYNGLTDALKPIKETTPSENAEKMLDTMIEEMTDSKVLMKEYQPYINRLQELRGQGTYSASEKLAIKRDFDRIIGNKLFNSKGMVSGIEEKTIAKWRNNLMQEIENEATKYGVDVKAYNVDVRNATTIRDGLLRRLSQENKNNEFGLQDIGIGAILGQGDPFISAGVIIAKKGTEKAMPNIAQKLYNLSDAKNVPTNLKRGVAITPRDVTDGFSIAPVVNDSLTTPGVTKALPAPKATVIAPGGLPQALQQPKVKGPSTPLILETGMKNVKKTPETPRKTIPTKTEALKSDILEGNLKKLQSDPTLEKVPQMYLQRGKDRVIKTKYGTVTEMIKNNQGTVIKVKVGDQIYDANDLDFFEKKIDILNNTPTKKGVDNQKSLETMKAKGQRQSIAVNEGLKELGVTLDNLDAQQLKQFGELVRARNFDDARQTKWDNLKQQVSKTAPKLPVAKKTPLKQAPDIQKLSPKTPKVLKPKTPMSKVDDALPLKTKMEDVSVLKARANAKARVDLFDELGDTRAEKAYKNGQLTNSEVKEMYKSGKLSKQEVQDLIRAREANAMDDFIDRKITTPSEKNQSLRNMISDDALPVGEKLGDLPQKAKSLDKIDNVRNYEGNLKDIYNNAGDDDYIILQHNTTANNVDSILKNGLDPSKGVSEGPGIMRTTLEQSKKSYTDLNYGGNEIYFKIKKSEANKYKVNDTEFTLSNKIPAKDIVAVNRTIKLDDGVGENGIITTTKAIDRAEDIIKRYGKDKLKEVYPKLYNFRDQTSQPTTLANGKPLPKVDNTLLSEARKYKSADGFVKDNILYRGETGGGGNYYSTDFEFARDFAPTGKESEVIKRGVLKKDIYKKDILPFAGSEDEITNALSEAKKKGKKAILVSEGKNQPNSVFVFDKSALKTESQLRKIREQANWKE